VQIFVHDLFSSSPNSVLPDTYLNVSVLFRVEVHGDRDLLFIAHSLTDVMSMDSFWNTNLSSCIT
jgi:hypothetical protein